MTQTTKKKTKRKRRATPKVDAQEYFASVAAKSTSKGGIPEVEIPRARDTVAELAQVLAELDSLEARKAELEATLLPLAETARLAESKKAGKALASVKVKGPNGELLSVVRRAMYSGITKGQWPQAVATTVATMGVTPEVAEAILADRLAWATDIKVCPSIADDKRAMAMLVKWVGPFLTIKRKAKPTKHFHACASLDDNERTLMFALESLVKPYKASVRS